METINKLYNDMLESISNVIKQTLYYNIDDNHDDAFYIEENPHFIERYVIKNIDLNKIPNNILEKIYNINYKDIKLFRKDWSDYLNDCIGINVSIKYSLTLEKVKENLMKYYNINDWQISNVFDYDEPNILLHIPTQICTVVSGKYYKDNFETINEIMSNYGYLYFHHFTKIINGRKWIYVVFNPKYPTIVNDYIKENIPILFHGSPICNHESIVKNGFMISGRNNDNIYYPDRLFFKMGNDGWNGFKKMLSHIADRYMDINPNREFNIYAIDSDKLVNKHTFYRDPNCKESCFTEDNISYNGFNIFKTIKV